MSAILVALAGCASIGPDYKTPVASVPNEWNAPLPHQGSVQELKDWWIQFDDPVLVKLLDAAERDSPTLAVAWGRIEQARATHQGKDAALLPSVSGELSSTQSRQAGDLVSTRSRSRGLDASWEIDQFGKARRNAQSASASLEAKKYDWHEARVSLSAEVATSYVQYCACTMLVKSYESELESMAASVKATESLVRAGMSPASDAVLMRATQASMASSLQEQGAQCDLLVKTMVNLTGLLESALRGMLKSDVPTLPVPPNLAVQQVPAGVIRQRPDVASSERALAAASANIGAAKADLYPSLKINGALSLATAAGVATSAWSIGPALSLTLFDGGANQSVVDSARASYEIAFAQWRASVRDAVFEVEKALVQLDNTGRRSLLSEGAAKEYQRYLADATHQLQVGTISTLSHEDIRRQALSAQLEFIGQKRDWVVSWITLYKAVGGGWEAPTEVAIPVTRAP